MAYDPHLKVTMLGDLPGGEVFSMSLALANPDSAEGGLQNWLGIGPNSTVHTDFANDCATWFGSGNAAIQSPAVLKRVKIAPIGSDGRYAGAPVERLVNQAGAQSVATLGTQKANQVAYTVTLHTAGDLGRVKGRFYVPLPGHAVESDGRVSAGSAAGWVTGAQELIENLGNQPGYDVLNLAVVVASQGRKNKDGSVRVGPQNHLVTGVTVGRVLDTVRRRRNKLLEGPRTLLATDQGE